MEGNFVVFLGFSSLSLMRVSADQDGMNAVKATSSHLRAPLVMSAFPMVDQCSQSPKSLPPLFHMFGARSSKR